MVTTEEEVEYVAKNQANSGSSGEVATGGRRSERDTGN
jgi:hypothetical protein